MTMTTRCKSCGAEIVFIRTVAGGVMPLDAKPHKRFVIQIDRNEAVAVSRDTYTSHFATCPNANAHRSQKEKNHGAQSV